MSFRFVGAILLLFCTSILESREIKHQIVLKPGQPDRVLSGSIRRVNDVVVYIFNAQAGQHIFIHLLPKGQLDAQAVLVAPSGKNVQNGPIFDSILDESGTFQIRIEPRGQTIGIFELRLSLH
jgi:hypothetical protein